MTDHATRDADLRLMLTTRRTEMQDDMRNRIRDERAGRPRDGHDTLEYTEAQIQGDIEFALLQMRSEALTRIEQAIVRLDTGKYGLCFECANDISAQRLRALPFAVRCQACEGARERRPSPSRNQPRSGLSIFAVGTVLLLATSTTMFAKPPARSTAATASASLEMQVLLARADFSPGEIDGSGGQNSRRAQAAFETAHGLTPGTRGRKALLAALGAGDVEPIASYTITAEDVAGPFTEVIPTDPAEQAKLPGLHYRTVLEGLGEQFHAAPALLKQLNPRARFVAGEQIRVPNLSGAEHAVAAGPVKIVVSKKASALTVFDKKGEIIFYAPVTSGSEHDSLPIGNWTVTAVARNPTFNYNPDLFWDADPTKAKATIPAGPNNPVGVVWIDIDKPHYGLHGTPEPGRIGYAESHGCVRLTNWDAARLATLVGKGTPVVFEE